VSLAIDARNRAIDEEGEIDEFWCVFDVEWPRNHPRLREAIDQARQNSIEVAVSNPCFELWLILHLQDRTAWLDTEDAEALRRSLDGASGKGLDPAIYLPLIDDATQRAIALDDRHMRNGTIFPHNNPSSGMHRLMTSVTATN
jgi:RloB-like protein